MKPTELKVWAEASTNVAEPPFAVRQAGYQFEDIVPSDEWNGLMRGMNRWIDYLDKTSMRVFPDSASFWADGSSGIIAGSGWSSTTGRLLPEGSVHAYCLGGGRLWVHHSFEVSWRPFGTDDPLTPFAPGVPGPADAASSGIWADDARVYVQSYDAVRVFDVLTGVLLGTITGGWFGCLGPDGSVFVVSSDSRQVDLYADDNYTTPVFSYEYGGPSATTATITQCHAQNGRLYIIGQAWGVNGNVMSIFSLNNPGSALNVPIGDISASSNGLTHITGFPGEITLATDDGKFFTYRVPTGVIGMSSAPLSWGVLSDSREMFPVHRMVRVGKYLAAIGHASGDPYDTVVIWDLSKALAFAVTYVASAPTNSFAFATDGLTIYVANWAADQSFMYLSGIPRLEWVRGRTDSLFYPPEWAI